MPADKIFNVGVIGYGLSAKVFHIPLIAVTPAFNLSAIVQRTPRPDDDASKDHPSATVYRSADELIRDPTLHIIVVTTTPETHFAFTKAALEAGKHVVVEKPFVPTSREAQQLVDLSAQTGRLICVYQNRRWDADFLTLRTLLDAGTLGRVVEYHTHFDRYKPARPANWKGSLTMEHAGGVVYDLGSHLIDQAYVLFGLPHTVNTVFVNQRDAGDGEGDPDEEPDAITVLLGYGRRGPLVTAKAGVMCVETEQLRFWVRGTRGSYRKCHLDVQEDQLKLGLKPGDAGFGVEDVARSGSLVTLREDGSPTASVVHNVVPQTYAALYEGFARAVEANDASAVPVKASEARDVLRIIEAARESARTGKTVSLGDV